MTNLPFLMTYEEALKSGGFEVFPAENKGNLQRSTKMLALLINCNLEQNFHKVCGQYTDATTGKTVYSYCDERGLCDNLFLSAP